MNQYSFWVGLSKSLAKVAVFGLSIAGVYLATNYPSLANTSILDLITHALQPVLGGLTVGGVVTLVLNYFKATGTPAGSAPVGWKKYL